MLQTKTKAPTIKVFAMKILEALFFGVGVVDAGSVTLDNSLKSSSTFSIEFALGMSSFFMLSLTSSGTLELVDKS